MDERTAAPKSLWAFFILLTVLSIPFLVVGEPAGDLLQQFIPINLPISAFMFTVPITAAVILTYRESGKEGVKTLLKRIVDFRKIKPAWYLPIIFLWPLTMIAAYSIQKIAGMPLPEPNVPLLIAPVFFAVFFIAGVCEEVGWQGYVIDRMQTRMSALGAALVVGTIWAVWHVIPLIQAHREPAWIFWQGFGMLPQRVLIVWLYNNNHRSVFAAIVYHAMANVSQFLFPNFGSHYDPMVAALILSVEAVMVILIWGPRTLAGRERRLSVISEH